MGVHSVKKRLADGSVRTYHYAWRGGPRILSEPGTRAFLAEYCQLTKAKPAPTERHTMADLIQAYCGSQSFQSLRGATRRDYERHINTVMEAYFDLPLAAIDERGMRSEFVDWRDERSDAPRSADLCFAVLRRILSFGVDREIIGSNPIMNVKPLSSGSRANIIWSDEQIASMNAVTSAPIRAAFMMALWTGQRQIDILTLKWSAYDGRHIRLKQSKGGRHVRIKVADPLRPVIDDLPRTAITMLTNTRGLPWTQSGFKASWRAAKNRMGIEGVTFHDLRGTFCTAAYRTGATFREIAEASGHSESEAERIIRKHYLAGDTVIERIEAGTKTVNQGDIV